MQQRLSRRTILAASLLGAAAAPALLGSLLPFASVMQHWSTAAATLRASTRRSDRRGKLYQACRWHGRYAVE